MITRTPNIALQDTIAEAGISHGALAQRVVELAATQGVTVHYTHRAVANWTRRGMRPQPVVRKLVAAALAERLARWVSLNEIGFAGEEHDSQDGLYFPRESAKAVITTTRFWSSMMRRDFLASITGVVISAYAVPVRRWLTTGSDPDVARPAPPGTSLRVGRVDITELTAAAEDARRWDSQFGGGNWRTSALDICLTARVAPLLKGTYTDQVGRALFGVAAQLSRLAGWTAFDSGRQGLAQRHYVQALRLARAAGDRPLGGYVLASMALQASLSDFHDDAIDMAQAASTGAGTAATPRTRSFYRLIEARAHARAGDVRSAHRALAAAETLLADADTRSGDDPTWIDFFTPARLAADAVEIFRDLNQPILAHQWNTRADAAAGFPRSAGLRGLVLATTYLQQTSPDLDAALHTADTALANLSGVSSARAHDYAVDLLDRCAPWAPHPGIDHLARAVAGSAIRLR